MVVPSENAAYEASENVIIGNVALYGATSGCAYINGIAGERFMVRNSGATAVCEGCGDHGLEYMTGGKAVILGDVGKNFAAGMSGGIAYVLDRNHSLYLKTNKSLIEMTELNDADRKELREILEDYEKCTKSKKAAEILSDFESAAALFKKIIPVDQFPFTEHIETVLQELRHVSSKMRRLRIKRKSKWVRLQVFSNLNVARTDGSLQKPESGTLTSFMCI